MSNNQPIKKYRAYCLWLIKQTGGEIELLSALLYGQLVSGNKMAFEIVFVDDTGYGNTMSLIEKVAQEILKTYDNE